MRCDGQDRYAGAPLTLNRVMHHDYQSSYLETYVSLRSFACLGPANERFCRAWPSIDTIGDMFGQTRTTVCNSLKWLEKNGYLYRTRRQRQSTIYTIILQRDRFLAVVAEQGWADAIEDYEAWITERQIEVRRDKARTASAARRLNANPHPSGRWGSKSRSLDFDTGKASHSALDVRLGETSCSPLRKTSRSGGHELDPRIGGTIYKRELSSTGTERPALSPPAETSKTESSPPFPEILATLRSLAKPMPVVAPLTEAQRQKRIEMLQRQKEDLLKEAHAQEPGR